jgi:hypothetical protein
MSLFPLECSIGRAVLRGPDLIGWGVLGTAQLLPGFGEREPGGTAGCGVA